MSLDGSWRNETCMKYVFETYTNCPTQERADFFNCDKKEYFCESDLKDVIDGKVSTYRYHILYIIWPIYFMMDHMIFISR